MIPLTAAAAVGYKVGPIAAAVAVSLAVAMSGAEISGILVAGFTAAGAAFAKVAEIRSRATAEEVEALRQRIEGLDAMEARARQAEASLHHYRLGAMDLTHQLKAEGHDPVWTLPS